MNMNRAIREKALKKAQERRRKDSGVNASRTAGRSEAIAKYVVSRPHHHRGNRRSTTKRPARIQLTLGRKLPLENTVAYIDGPTNVYTAVVDG